MLIILLMIIHLIKHLKRDLTRLLKILITIKHLQKKNLKQQHELDKKDREFNIDLYNKHQEQLHPTIKLTH